VEKRCEVVGVWTLKWKSYCFGDFDCVSVAVHSKVLVFIQIVALMSGRDVVVHNIRITVPDSPKKIVKE